MCHIIDGMNVYEYNQCSVYMKNTSIRPKYILKKKRFTAVQFENIE